VRNKIALQKRVYRNVRKRFRFPAPMTIRAIAKVVKAYKRFFCVSCGFAGPADGIGLVLSRR